MQNWSIIKLSFAPVHSHVCMHCTAPGTTPHTVLAVQFHIRTDIRYHTHMCTVTSTPWCIFMYKTRGVYFRTRTWTYVRLVQTQRIIRKLAIRHEQKVRFVSTTRTVEKSILINSSVPLLSSALWSSWANHLIESSDPAKRRKMIIWQKSFSFNVTLYRKFLEVLL